MYTLLYKEEKPGWAHVRLKFSANVMCEPLGSLVNQRKINCFRERENSFLITASRHIYNDPGCARS